MNTIWLSNGTLALLLLGGIILARAISRDRLRREAWLELWHRRPIAITIVAIYLLIGAIDSIVWISGNPTNNNDDAVAAFAAGTLDHDPDRAHAHGGDHHHH